MSNSEWNNTKTPSPPRLANQAKINQIHKTRLLTYKYRNDIMNGFMRDYINRAVDLKNTTNLNRNGLRFSIRRTNKQYQASHKPQAILALRMGKKKQAYIVVEPLITKNGQIKLYFVEGKSIIQRKGYGEYLRALADRIGTNVGAIGTNQWAVNMHKMVARGQEPPSAGIMRKLGGNPYVIKSMAQFGGIHFNLPRTRSRSTGILKRRFGVKMPNMPRSFERDFELMNTKMQFLKVRNINRPYLKNNAHAILMKYITNQNFKNALDPLLRRVRNKHIKPMNLLFYYHTLLNRRVESSLSRLKTLIARKDAREKRRIKFKIKLSGI